MNKVLEEKIDDLEDIYLAEKTLEEIRAGNQLVSPADDVLLFRFICLQP